MKKKHPKETEVKCEKNANHKPKEWVKGRTSTTNCGERIHQKRQRLHVFVIAYKRTFPMFREAIRDEPPEIRGKNKKHQSQNVTNACSRFRNTPAEIWR